MSRNDPSKLVVQHHLSYGQNYYYAVNETAKLLLEFISPKRRVFTSEQIDVARKLGYVIEIVPMEIPVYEKTKTMV